MGMPTIFLASSKGAKALAEALQIRLLDELDDSARLLPWWGVDAFPQGHSTLDSLLDRCQQSDFSIVLLTKDDVTLKRGVRFQAPRDNCIFEAGLFTGAFSFKKDEKRCFLLSSLQPDDLPSDLRGITHIRIEEDPQSPSIQRAAAKIRDSVKSLSSLSRPEVSLLTEEELLTHEHTMKDGHLAKGAPVLLSLVRPIEVDVQFAKRVLTNIQSGARYTYFFSVDNLSLIAELVQALATVGVAGDGPMERRRATAKRSDAQTVEGNLIHLRERLRICLVAFKTCLEVCIHNADRGTAKCYLRAGDGRFLLWADGERAIDVANEIKRNVLESNDGPNRIFMPTRDCDPYGKEGTKLYGELTRSVQELFDPNLHVSVMAACFGAEASKTASG